MSVEIFAINSGVTTFKYGVTLGIPGTGLLSIYDKRQLVNVSAIQNKYSGTISYSGYVSSQNFG